MKEKLGNRKLTTFIVTYKPLQGHGSDEVKKEMEAIKEQFSNIPQLIILNENIYMKGFSSFMRNNSNYAKILDDLPAIMS